MVTFTINIPQMLRSIYTSTMDPMGMDVSAFSAPRIHDIFTEDLGGCCIRRPSFLTKVFSGWFSQSLLAPQFAQAAGFFFGGHCEDWKPYSTRTRYSKELDYLLIYIYNLYKYIYIYVHWSSQARQHGIGYDDGPMGLSENSVPQKLGKLIVD